jgi:hypothetical protein
MFFFKCFDNKIFQFILLFSKHEYNQKLLAYKNFYLLINQKT